MLQRAVRRPDIPAGIGPDSFLPGGLPSSKVGRAASIWSGRRLEAAKVLRGWTGWGMIWNLWELLCGMDARGRFW